MAILKNAIKSVDPAPEKRDEINLALDLMFELASAKCEAFNTQIADSLRTAGTQENPTIPITNTLAHQYDMRGYVKENAGSVIPEVMDALGKFIDGGTKNILGGITSILSASINTLLGAGEGTQLERHDYFIAVEGFAIVRLDVKMWVRHISVKGITDKIESIMAFSAIKSSVDINKISFNTFLQAYKLQLEMAGLSAKDLMAEIELAKKIFYLLKENNNEFKAPTAPCLCEIELTEHNMIMPGSALYIK